MKKILLLLGITASVLLFTQSSAEAAFRLSIASSSGSSVLITDNNTIAPVGTLQGDANSSAGRIVWFGTVDGWEVNVVGSLSKPAVGSAGNPVMDINYNITHVSDATATLTIRATDTGFTPLPGYPLTGRVDGNATGGPLGVSTYQIFYDNSNTEFGTANGSGVAVFSGTSYGVAIPGTLTVTGPVPYSLTQQLVFSAPLGVTTTGDANLQATPAPAGIVLIAAGLPFLGLGCWLKRRKRA